MQKSGYSFVGWCEDAKLGTVVEIEKVKITANKTFYAKWKKINDGGGHDGGGGHPGQYIPTKDQEEEKLEEQGKNVTIQVELSNPFSDIKNSDWFYESVLKSYHAGIILGMGNGKFEPNLNTTRAMTVNVLWKIAGSPTIKTESSFTDIAEKDWYKEAVVWATESGIAKGYDDKTFRPNLSITREELVTFLYRYVEHFGKVTKSGDLNGFEDKNLVSSYAIDAMNWAVGNGIISGKGNGKLDPLGLATRAELACVIDRFLEFLNIK